MGQNGPDHHEDHAQNDADDGHGFVTYRVRCRDGECQNGWI